MDLNSLGSFDASNIKPEQGGSKHPVGMFPFEITDTDIVSTKDNTGGMFAVTFTSPAGKIINNYNLWNRSPQAVEIANKQLSALCHAVGIFKLNWANKGRELVGGRGSMKINWQRDNAPTPEKPEGGFVEVEKVFDINGNEPGKPPSQPQTQQNFNQQPQNNPPMQQQPGGGWSQPNQQPQQQPQQPMQQAGPGWGNPPTGAAPQGFQQPQNGQVTGGNNPPPPWRQPR